MKNKERKRIYKLYNHLYERHYIDERWSCFYCNSTADTLDHVPPLSWLEPYGIEAFKKARIPLVTIPCCFECNIQLGDKKLFTVDARLSHLEKIYHDFFDELTHWETEEIQNMGESFKKSLKVQKHREDELKEKIRAIEQRSVKPWTFPDFYDYEKP